MGKTIYKINYNTFSKKEYINITSKNLIDDKYIIKDDKSKEQKYIICKDYPELPTIIPAKKRILVMGDIHGDFNVTIETLKLAKVINDNYDWIAEPKDTVVVQIGDQIDRCRPFLNNCLNEDTTIDDENSDVKILKFFTELHSKALKYGGAVYSLLGNHEIMNVQGKLKYVSKKGIDEFIEYEDSNNEKITFENGIEGRKYAFKPGNELAKFMACTRQTAIIIGSFLFVHAAIIPKLLKKYKIENKNDLSKINKLIRLWLLDILKEQKIDTLLNDHKISPFWPRIFGSLPHNISMDNDDCEKHLKPVLDILEIDGMIIGHTPQFYTNKKGINSTCDNKVWRTDHGASKAFDPFGDFYSKKYRKIQILEIIDDKIFNIIKS